MIGYLKLIASSLDGKEPIKCQMLISINHFYKQYIIRSNNFHIVPVTIIYLTDFRIPHLTI